jgi:hypothetical protein
LYAADAPKLEAKLHGEWKGGACQGTFSFKPDGTYRLEKWSPGNHMLSGTWAMKWDALPPTLVLTCKESNSKEYVGAEWKVKVSELDRESLSLVFRSAKEGDATIRYTRIKKSAEPKAVSDYIKVEIRGKLRTTDLGDILLIEDLANQPVNITIQDMPLAFGGDKVLAALAKKLDGRTVVVYGNLARAAAERIAIQPKHYLSYVRVTALKEAE